MGRRTSQYFLKILKQQKETGKKEQKSCDIPNCKNFGEFKAPKDSQLKEYYLFCMKHVEEYNKNWNYFKDMPASAVEEQIYNNMLWDRPTWQMAPSSFDTERLRRRIYENMGFDNIHINMGGEESKRYGQPSVTSPEMEAMATMELEPPVTWDIIKGKYRTLVKKYHPDLYGGKNEEIEEKLKNINLAYSVLKIAYHKYQKLENN